MLADYSPQDETVGQSDDKKKGAANGGTNYCADVANAFYFVINVGADGYSNIDDNNNGAMAQ